jgi:hypothetical protein
VDAEQAAQPSLGAMMELPFVGVRERLHLPRRPVVEEFLLNVGEFAGRCLVEEVREEDRQRTVAVSHLLWFLAHGSALVLRCPCAVVKPAEDVLPRQAAEVLAQRAAFESYVANRFPSICSDQMFDSNSETMF